MDIVARAGAFRHAPLTELYCQADQAVKDKGYFAYRKQESSFVRAEAGLAGQVACGHHGTRVPAQR